MFFLCSRMETPSVVDNGAAHFVAADYYIQPAEFRRMDGPVPCAFL